MPVTKLSRGLDYLGDLGAKLRDLTGFSTLAHELIQNAEDAQASRMWFTITADALIVDNDETFHGCRAVEAPHCGFISTHGHLCDFHRFRRVASADKRDQPGTIGAFGLGFITVYQVTDRPELLSCGRHWLLHEEADDSERIHVCPGCQHCADPGLPGTRFILPWAFAPDTPLRRGLRADSLTSDAPAQLANTLRQILPTAILFLSHLSRFDVTSHVEAPLTLERITEENSVCVSNGSRDDIWHLLKEDFDPVALRTRHPNRIEEKRSPRVTLAIPEEPLESGLLCAFLPTEYRTGLPFHLNADFFPSSDRKRVVFDEGYQGEWNRAAVGAAAEALSKKLSRLPDRLGVNGFWRFLQQVRRVADEAQKGRIDYSFASLWDTLSPRLPQHPVVFTAGGTWRLPKDASLPEQDLPDNEALVLEELGVPVVHGNLRPCFNLLRAAPLSVPLLELSRVTQALVAAGLTRRTTLLDLPSALQSETKRNDLYAALGSLLAQRKPARNSQDLQAELATCALAPAHDGAYWPCRDTYRADEETTSLFSRIFFEIAFLKERFHGMPLFAALCPNFSAQVAVRTLSSLSPHALGVIWQRQAIDPVDLLHWCAGRAAEFERDPELRRQLAAVPLFPAGNGFRPLTELALPGDFHDPLALTDVVDLRHLAGRRDFLRLLGSDELTFPIYAARYLPQALANPGLAPATLNQALILLATKLGEIRDSAEVRDALRTIPLFPCVDGKRRRPDETYLPSSRLGSLLDHTPHLLAPAAPDGSALRELAEWLGARTEPTISDLVLRIRTLASAPPNAQAIQAVGRIVSHFMKHIERLRSDDATLKTLRQHRWLPAEDDTDTWCQPSELSAVYRRHLFESQGRFLAFPFQLQQDAAELLALLGVRSEPTPRMVVAHLSHCIRTGELLHHDVYRFLDENADDPALDRLGDLACLPVIGGHYARPIHVFSPSHPFGRFRFLLDPQLRKYTRLLDRLGVKQTATFDDALQILAHLANDPAFAPGHPLDKDAHAILLAAWRLLAGALEDGHLAEERLANLRGVRCIPNEHRELMPPALMLFADRHGLASAFEPSLERHLTPRHIGLSRAMEVAGVRPYLAAATAELLECVTPRDDEHLSRLLTERAPHMRRVLEVEKAGTAAGAMTLTLDQIHGQVADHLVRRAIVRFDAGTFVGQADTVPAHLDHETCTLYVVPIADALPWRAIARELSAALTGNAQPTSIAATISLILEAPSDEDATASLTELGFPPVTAAPPSAPGNGCQPQEYPTSSGETSPAAPGAEPGESTPGPSGDTAESGKPSGGNVSQTTQRAARTSQRSGAGAQARLRSYVVPTTNGEGQPERQLDTARLREIDRLGVNHVLAYERNHGRTPSEMPPNHPGYDIESRDAEGTLLRYIEVKSTSDAWGDRGVALSDTQFEKAASLSERYWLYVVERADAPAPILYRINDPAGQAGEFFFDGGWRVVAEPDPQVENEASDE